MRLLDFVLRTWSMSSITFWTSIPFYEMHLFGLCSPTESWYMKQGTASKNTCVIWFFVCKEYGQISSTNFKKWRGLKRKCVMKWIWNLFVLRTISVGVVLNHKLRRSNILPPPIKQLQFEVLIENIWTNSRGLPWLHLSGLHIPQGFGHLMGRSHIPKLTIDVICDVNILNYLWNMQPSMSSKILNYAIFTPVIQLIPNFMSEVPYIITQLEIKFHHYLRR